MCKCATEVAYAVHKQIGDMHGCIGCMDAFMHLCMYVGMYACMHACRYVCMHACMYVCMHVWMYVCMHACMYVCMYGCMYVCSILNVHQIETRTHVHSMHI